ncbi:Type IV fimbrial biogenesis protein PilW [Myxococcus hansupus]|uniref:Type IV fimbrial biogenesis protein PilW n=1 Tax=Pseudomyxococcus hansupus TaxID=1297742 RepID=A0A0H4X707_9BACT|nr:prepilin-type N-terminal cleavage/methylation domain-containing protein [Myxococcus hansupus]AKQ69728.1 Type IV fimbrial biogenesis protein PilW [Myxococcus hansupus]
MRTRFIQAASRASRGFTLIEVMIASAIGIIVLAVGLMAATQMQRRALFEEQTMTAQTTGRAIKELLAADLMRTGAGMGNAPINFHDMRRHSAIQVWTEPDLSTAVVTRPFLADPNFALPPADYAAFTSDVLQLHWGDTRGMVTLQSQNCSFPNVRESSQVYCTALNPSTLLQPTTTPTVPAFAVNPNRQLACHLRVTGVDSGTRRVTVEPGMGADNTTFGPCSDAPSGNFWNDDPTGGSSWFIMRAQSASYRVNWAGGTPALEYLAPGAADWVVVSRDVERLKVRLAVTSVAPPLGVLRWFPDVANGRPNPIDECTIDTCPIELHPEHELAPPGTPEELRDRLWQRVREVEVTLTVRTAKQDRDAFNPALPMALDAEGFPIDGYKRRTFTFRVTLRNFAAGGLLPRLTET